MPCEVQWLKKPYVFEVTLSGVITDDEFHQFASEVIALLEEGGRVDAITLLNATELKRLPAFNVLRREFGRVPGHFEGQDLGLSVVYGVNILVRYIVEVLTRVAGMRFKVFSSREEAETFVWQMVDGMQAQ